MKKLLLSAALILSISVFAHAQAPATQPQEKPAVVKKHGKFRRALGKVGRAALYPAIAAALIINFLDPDR